MYIEKINIGSFGRLSDKEIELKSGANILVGENESGKSTLCEFIKFVFYGLSSKSTDGEMSERTRYISWKTNDASGSVVINTDEGRFRVERTTVPHGTGYKDSVTVVDLSANSIVSDIKKPGDYFFGIPESVFVNTVYVRQTDGARFEGQDIGNAVENIFYSADESVNTSKALKKLDEARKMIKHKNNTGRGETDRLERIRDELSLRLSEARNANQGLLQAEASLRSTEAALEKTKNECNRISRQIRKSELGAILLKIGEKLRYSEKVAELKKQKSDYISSVAYNGFLPDNEYEAQLKKAENELYFLKKSIENISDNNIGDDADEAKEVISEKVRDHGGRTAVTERAASILGKKKTFTAVSVLFFVMFAFAVLMYFTVGKLFEGTSWLFLLSSGVFLITALLSVGVVIKTKQAKGALFGDFGVSSAEELSELLADSEDYQRIRRAAFERRIMAEKNRESAENELMLYAKKQAELLGKWGRTPEDDGIISVSSAIKAALNDIEDFKNKISLFDRELDKYDTVYELLSEKLKGVDEKQIYDEYMSIDEDIDGKSFDELKKHLDFYKKAGDELTEKRIGLEKNMIELKAKTESPSKLESELRVVEDRIKELTFKHSAYVLAYEALVKAGDSLRGRLAPGLSAAAGRLMGDLTDGKYSELGVSDSLELTYSSNEQGYVSTRSIDCVSSGTQDAAYVSLRLALADMFGKNGTRLPVVFDEAFSRLDDKRLRRMLCVVQKYAENGAQAIVLTSNKREADVVREMNALDSFNCIGI